MLRVLSWLKMTKAEVGYALMVVNGGSDSEADQKIILNQSVTSHEPQILTAGTDRLIRPPCPTLQVHYITVPQCSLQSIIYAFPSEPPPEA